MHKINRRTFFLFFIFLPFLSSNKVLAKQNKPNLVVIWKKKRVLALYNRDQLIKAYRIRLGFNPQGQKQKEGDGRTPEGKYFITHKNPNSKFFLSLGLNYPNQVDKTRASRKGNNPGSDIYIHGLGKKNILLHYFFDWTNGCIAVTNKEIEEIYKNVDTGTVVYIYS
jgi:murein L,D-transpeptidase YafK